MSHTNPPSALVFGATGYTGISVVSSLLERSVATTAHIRPESSAREAWGRRFEGSGAQVAIAPWEEGEITALVAETGPTHVFALLGTTRKRQRHVAGRGEDPATETYATIDRDLTLMVLRACAALPSAPCFVYLSALGADPNARLPYMRVRGDVEAELERGGGPFVIAQPGFITGSDREESRPMERFGAFVFDGMLGVAATVGMGALRARYASITGPDLAQALVEAALSSNAQTRMFLKPQDLRPATQS